MVKAAPVSGENLRQPTPVWRLAVGLANRVSLIRDVPIGHCVTWADVRMDETDEAYRYRRAMEEKFSSQS
jgi:predicted homoserine dehydrogenase-like protein